MPLAEFPPEAITSTSPSPTPEQVASFVIFCICVTLGERLSDVTLTQPTLSVTVTEKLLPFAIPILVIVELPKPFSPVLHSK